VNAPAEQIIVSVVMPLFDAAGTLSQQLDALAHQTTDVAWELILADNGSTDATAEIIDLWSGHHGAVRVVDASTRPGPAHARNCGARHAAGELLLFCDADDEVDPDWIASMVRAWRGGGDLFGGRLEVETGNKPEVLMWRDPIQETHLPVGYQFLPFSLSANFGCTAESFRRLGGYDETFSSATGEDAELCFRAQLAGLSLSFVPDAVVAYRHRGDLRGSLRQALAYGAIVPVLYKKFQHQGFPRPPLRTHAHRVWRHLGKAPMLVQGRGPRGWWLWNSARLIGRLKGAVENRVLFW
jgi:glycosyltransferase involved in cell wall biosynthesis